MRYTELGVFPPVLTGKSCLHRVFLPVFIEKPPQYGISPPPSALQLSLGVSSTAAVGDPSLCIAPNQAVLPCLLPLLIGAVPFFSRENEEVCLEEEQPKRDQCCRARSTGLPQLSPMLRSVQSLVPHSPAVLLLLLLLLFSPSRGEMQNLSKEIFIVALRYFKMSAFLSNFNIFLPFFFFLMRHWMKGVLYPFFVWRILRVGASLKLSDGMHESSDSAVFFHIE